MDHPYYVIVIVDRAFGEKLATLPKGVPVWIVESPENQAAAKAARENRLGEDHLTGITVFTSADHYAPETVLLGEIGTIELHHGFYSADPPYWEIDVIGTHSTEAVRKAFADFGLTKFENTDYGFRAFMSTETGQPKMFPGPVEI